MSRFRIAAAAAACAFVIAGSAPVAAQSFTGRIDAVIEDAAGKPLPGASVALSGAISQTAVADDQGQAHFPNLPVGTYHLKASLAGLAEGASGGLDVRAGASTATTVRLGAAAAAEGADATKVAPPLDRRNLDTTTHVTSGELQSIPNARDVWSALQRVPTVYQDRVNVGGADSGLQASYNAKGARNTDNTWILDGVPITDMGDTSAAPHDATGASPLYYDVDSLEEMAVTTGGPDAQNPTPGVRLNLVLKRGLDQPHGSVRMYYESPRLESVNMSADLAAALAESSGTGNRIDKYQDYGFELGGPLLQDSLWVWGTIGRTTLDLLTLKGSSDNTSFENSAFKLDGRLNAAVRGNFTFYENNKSTEGRDASPLRPPETTWNESAPVRFYKGEGSFVIRNNLFATAKGAWVDGGFQLVPAGGLDKDYYIDDTGAAHNSYYQYQSTRPQYYGGGDVSAFLSGHELKFGGSWRKTPVDTLQTFPASHLVAAWNTYPNMIVQAARDNHAITDARYISAYVTDTLALDQLTITAGVRFDHQVSSLKPSSVAGVAGIAVLPDLAAPGADGVYTWKTVTPRVGMTYSLDQSSRTVVRASYAMFASQLPASQAAFVSPIQNAYAYYNAVDRNGDGVAQVSELLLNQGLQGFAGFDPKNPSRTTSVNRVDGNLTAPRTQEFVVGLDQALMSDVTLSATYTYRRMQDLLWTPLIGVTRANYSQTGTLTGNVAEVGAFNVPLYALNPLAVPDGAGKISTNRPGYSQRYRGLELTATKRMSKRWMARAGLSTNEWREYFDDPSTAILDPTRSPSASVAFPFAGPQDSGGPVVRSAAGTGESSVYMVAPAYQFFANGLVEVFWGVSAGANLVSRQGYVEPFFQSNVSTGDPLGRKSVLLVQHVDDFRLPAVTTLDIRLEKKFTFGTSKIAFDFDIFNALNAATVLGKQYDARLTGATGFDQVLEIMNPRIARVGLRFLF